MEPASTTRARAPVVHAGIEARTTSYVIRPGDTLYSIAWRFGVDYRQLAAWNGIGPPYRIFAGGRLRLQRPRFPPPAVARGGAIPAPPSAASAAAGADAVNGAAVPLPDTLRWQWPALGRVTETAGVLGEKGIDILGKFGEPVVAAAPGEVVYSGSGLIGYGKLIIIRHDDLFLSAYAHNDKLLVREGAKVAGGQKIAEMGRSGTRQVMLHFEIRLNGKPVPPLQYLPKKPF